AIGEGITSCKASAPKLARGIADVQIKVANDAQVSSVDRQDHVEEGAQEVGVGGRSVWRDRLQAADDQTKCPVVVTCLQTTVDSTLLQGRGVRVIDHQGTEHKVSRRILSSKARVPEGLVVEVQLTTGVVEVHPAFRHLSTVDGAEDPEIDR